MRRAWTEADYDRLSFHDDSLYGWALELGEAQDDDWTADLVLDLDHIVEWQRAPDGTMRFLVAPATLVFHGVTDLVVSLDWGANDYRVAPWQPTVSSLEREPIVDRQVFLDRPYWRWRLGMSSPRDAEIRLGAVGFRLELRREPMLLSEQRIPRRLRRVVP